MQMIRFQDLCKACTQWKIQQNVCLLIRHLLILLSYLLSNIAPKVLEWLSETFLQIFVTVIGHFVSIPYSNISLQARFAKIVRGLRHEGSAAGMPLIDPSVTVETVLAYSKSKLTERESSTDQPRHAGYNTLILLRVYCRVRFWFDNIW